MTERPHYTDLECRRMLPEWQKAAERNLREMLRAIEREDWTHVHRLGLGMKWNGTNLSLIALDMSYHKQARTRDKSAT